MRRSDGAASEGRATAVRADARDDVRAAEVEPDRARPHVAASVGGAARGAGADRHGGRDVGVPPVDDVPEPVPAGVVSALDDVEAALLGDPDFAPPRPPLGPPPPRPPETDRARRLRAAIEAVPPGAACLVDPGGLLAPRHLRAWADAVDRAAGSATVARLGAAERLAATEAALDRAGPRAALAARLDAARAWVDAFEADVLREGHRGLVTAALFDPAVPPGPLPAPAVDAGAWARLIDARPAARWTGPDAPGVGASPVAALLPDPAADDRLRRAIGEVGVRQLHEARRLRVRVAAAARLLRELAPDAAPTLAGLAHAVDVATDRLGEALRELGRRLHGVEGAPIPPILVGLHRTADHLDRVVVDVAALLAAVPVPPAPWPPPPPEPANDAVAHGRRLRAAGRHGAVELLLLAAR